MTTPTLLKAISLWQPWATLWALQLKINETRSWEHSYRGPLAVHAAQTKTVDLIQMCEQEPFRTVLRAAGYSSFLSLPRGCILAVCDRVECFEIVETDFPLPPETAINKYREFTPISPRERAFGDFTAGRRAWEPQNMRVLKLPIPCRGAQQLWNVPAEIAAQIYAQLES